MKFGGLDLSAKEGNPSGVCIYPFSCRTLYTDKEIEGFFSEVDLVAVDAPLTYSPPWRDAERELLRLGFRPLPLSMKSMRLLYERVERLKPHLPELIETFVTPMRTRLVEYLAKKMGWNKHERDAFICSLVAKAYAEGRAVAVGKENPIYIIKKEDVDREVLSVLRGP